MTARRYRDGASQKVIDDGVRQRTSEPYADRTGDNRETREAVGAIVIAICDQRRAIDLTADPNAE